MARRHPLALEDAPPQSCLFSAVWEAPPWFLQVANKRRMWLLLLFLWILWEYQRFHSLAAIHCNACPSQCSVLSHTRCDVQRVQLACWPVCGRLSLLVECWSLCQCFVVNSMWAPFWPVCHTTAKYRYLETKRQRWEKIMNKIITPVGNLSVLTQIGDFRLNWSWIRFYLNWFATGLDLHGLVWKWRLGSLDSTWLSEIMLVTLK